MPARCASDGGDHGIDDLPALHRVGERRFECGPGGGLIAAPHLEQNIERRLRKVGEGVEAIGAGGEHRMVAPHRLGGDQRHPRLALQPVEGGARRLGAGQAARAAAGPGG